MWTPEVYQSVSWPVTVVRIVDSNELDDAMHYSSKALAYFFHFDFEVEARVRELGNCLSFFKLGSEPPEKRVQSDSGKPKPSDRTAFCVLCHPQKIKDVLLPAHETVTLKEAVEAAV
jgi:hypothetical protein